MSSSSPVTLIIPCFNEENRLPDLLAKLDALRSRDLQDWQVILVDDASADGTFARLLRAKAERPWIDVLRHHEPQGRGAALRTAIEQSMSPVLYAIEGSCGNFPDRLPDPADLLDQDTDIASIELGGPADGANEDSPMRRFGARLAHMFGNAEERSGSITLWAYRRDKLQRIHFFSNGPVALREIELRGRIAGLKVRNIKHLPGRATSGRPAAAGIEP